jgi:Uma2 family endonuclease
VALTDQRITAAEFLELPLDEYRFTQLVDGEIVVSEATLRHQDLYLFIVRRLADWADAGSARGRAGIPVDVVLDDRNVFAPDVWWVSEEHRPSRDARALDGPPDLAVEVRSPSTWRYDIGVKKDHYERAGLPELWLVDTESETVLIHRRSSPAAREFDVTLELGADEALTSPLLPGFLLAVSELFDR